METPDFFRARIHAMINLSDPLAVLAGRLPWDQIEVALRAERASLMDQHPTHYGSQAKLRIDEFTFRYRGLTNLLSSLCR